MSVDTVFFLLHFHIFLFCALVFLGNRAFSCALVRSRLLVARTFDVCTEIGSNKKSIFHSLLLLLLVFFVYLYIYTIWSRFVIRVLALLFFGLFVVISCTTTSNILVAGARAPEFVYSQRARTENKKRERDIHTIWNVYQKQSRVWFGLPTFVSCSLLIWWQWFMMMTMMKM